MDAKEIKEILSKDLSELTPRERAYALVEKIKIYREFGAIRMRKDNETDIEKALRLTRKVSFLTAREERGMYAGALLAAIRWGKRIDRINRESQKSVIELAGGEKPEERPETMDERRERIRKNFEKSVELQKFFKQYK